MMTKEEIQSGILGSVNEMWQIFAAIVSVNAAEAIEQFLEEKDKVHKFLIEIKD